MPRVIKKRIVKKTASEIKMKGILSRIKGYAGERKNIFVAAAIAVIISSAAITGFFIYSHSLKREADKLGYEAYKTYYGLYQKQPIPKDEQYKKAMELFKKAYDTKKSPLSLFYIANCYYEMGRYEDAINTLKDLNQKFPDDERFVPLSYFKMAMAALKKGSSEDALKSLDVLYNYKTGSYKDLSLVESGKILEAMGRSEDAKKKYEELTKNFPQSPFSEEIKTTLVKKEKKV
ncbi:MAG: tetratricopeptide repeat protein [Nitrospirae bacterium]|nr:tetratricopeptide repeat protein [Nitrospirota bacterium]